MSAVKVTDTTLRDGHQSLWATRMKTGDMLPVADMIDKIGYHSVEVWGGATFDVCMRFLGEDPWQRLKALKSSFKKTPLQMLLRGQSLVGYQHYPDDMVEAFVNKAVSNGIDIIRIFDALNDTRNLATSIRAAREAGAHVQAAVVYTVSPVHTTGHYLDTAYELAQMGAHSICIKDMAGLLTPYAAYELVKGLKKQLGLPVQLHSHYIGGLAVGTYLKAAEAGVDIIDTASLPLAFGPSQPPVETVVRALKDTPFDTGLDLYKLFEVTSYFEDLRKARGYERGLTRINDMRVFDHQVPGGMISNLIIQLEQQKSLHRLNEVLEEIPRVRREFGYPPLVTPTSQIVGTQAVLNVLSGCRYKLVPGEVKAYFQGKYGKPPGRLDEAAAETVLGGQEVISGRPADLLEPVMEKARQDFNEIAKCEEDILTLLMFPQVARKFLSERDSADVDGGLSQNQCLFKVKQVREEKKLNIDDVKEIIKLIKGSGISELVVEGSGMKMVIRQGGCSEDRASDIMPQTDITIEAIGDKDKEKVVVDTAPVAGDTESIIEVTAPMVGIFYRSPAPDAPPYIEKGDQIKKGAVLCIIEAMKLMNEIKSDLDGEVVEVLVENGHPLEFGQVLFRIRTN